jgi:hypothetical protein
MADRQHCDTHTASRCVMRCCAVLCGAYGWMASEEEEGKEWSRAPRRQAQADAQSARRAAERARHNKANKKQRTREKH